jgi:hypothetical protein
MNLDRIASAPHAESLPIISFDRRQGQQKSKFKLTLKDEQSSQIRTKSSGAWDRPQTPCATAMGRLGFVKVNTASAL